MSNKKIILLSACLFIIIAGATQCKQSCTPTIAACSDVVPTNEMCAAFFRDGSIIKAKVFAN